MSLAFQILNPLRIPALTLEEVEMENYKFARQVYGEGATTEPTPHLCSVRAMTPPPDVPPPSDLGRSQAAPSFLKLCEDCEEPIPAKRLAAVPLAVYCVACQPKYDRRVSVREGAMAVMGDGDQEFEKFMER